MKKSQTLIMGRNTIRELLKSAPGKILEVYTSQKKGKDPLYGELLSHNKRVIDMPKARLSQMVDSESHQSYVAAIKSRHFVNFKSFIDRAQKQEKSLVLMLDSIYDPQNFGTLLRAAECYGANLVIYSTNRGCDITPVVTKTAQGATELVPICGVSNLAECLPQLQAAGYRIAATEISPRSKSLYDYEFNSKTVLIMGSEGEGIQKLLSKRSDDHIAIPMHGQIDSLNVSQATAVLLDSYRRNHPNRST